ncbi:MAG: hypothetical protein KJ697_01120 [Nanoarchaeota archaeon]|nr:hypothetical protein [Nanoarchaeota archaeon]
MTVEKINILCEKCQRFRYAHSWVVGRLYDSNAPDRIDMLINATFSLYRPGEQTNELPCDALEPIVKENSFEKPDYCLLGRCLVLDTMILEKKELIK